MNILPEIADHPLLDTVEAIDNLGGDVELFRQVIELFLDDVYVQYAALESALAAGDYPTGRRIAHTLKGTASSVGAKRLVAVALHLEKASASQDRAVAAVTLPVLKTEIETAHTAFERYLSETA